MAVLDDLYYAENEAGLSEQQVFELISRALRNIRKPVHSVLLVGPDYTRRNSFGGVVCEICHQILSSHCNVDFLEATGTHAPMSLQDRRDMYPKIPEDHFFSHDWRNDTVCLGRIPAERVREISENILASELPVEINRRVVDPNYDLIISVGQVVPHAVAGMANYSKNFIVGVGGESMINATHLVGACYGMEKIMGRDKTPARNLMDYAFDQFLGNLPVIFMQTVTASDGTERPFLYSLSISADRRSYEYAVQRSAEKNITWLNDPLQTAVAYLDPLEFHSTWTANKAIHRLKSAIKPGGSLVVVAPGVHCFSEDAVTDRLIEKYGYCGIEKIKEYRDEYRELRENLAAAAHLIHGSADKQFTVYYHAPLLGKERLESVGYRYITEKELRDRFGYPDLKPGFQDKTNPNSIFYVPNPALGLWIWDKERR